jgi:predicted enzyme related to lactoylglutathione lyase
MTAINYIEFKSTNIKATQTFYTLAFGWKFTDFGPDYTSFENSGVKGGFQKTDEKITNGILVVLYHKKLEEIRDTIQSLGAEISKDISPFPGGKRFHFIDPSGNELAVWSE